MRINRYIAQVTGMSRRAADTAIAEGRVLVNGHAAQPGLEVTDQIVTMEGRVLEPKAEALTVMLNKPVGYVCSRAGQGNRTIYDLLPPELHHLKPVGRLDKDSSGLLLLTDDGQLAQELTHPSYQKEKIYEVTLDKTLAEADKAKLEQGVPVEDYVSRLKLETKNQEIENSRKLLVPGSYFLISMTEGRNRQIRRTFAALGYNVTKLHRIHFGPYKLGSLKNGDWKQLNQTSISTEIGRWSNPGTVG